MLSEAERAQFADPWWRLCHLYSIVNDEGLEMRFQPNDEQRDFFDRLWNRNLILKARQLGFTTFVDLLALDQCVFVPNTTAAIIAHSLDDAQRIFRAKVLAPYRRLPEIARQLAPLVKESASELVFANGSSISVSTSVRSGTVHFLHVSEMGKIVRKYPERSREIVTGSFEAVPKDGIIVVESTAEGTSGWFHDAVQAAKRSRAQQSVETPLDFRLHFYPWHKKQGYRLADEGVIFTDTQLAYFERIERELSIRLDPAQRAWYVKKQQVLGEDMLREYPSSEEESFAQSTEGRIYGKEMLLLRSMGRLGRVPVRPGIAVNTFWDLGVNDLNTIWLHQRVGAMNRFLRYFAGANEGMRHYWELLERWRSEHDAKWGRHYLPHDGDTRIQGYEVTTRKAILEECGARGVQIVPRISDKRTGIELVRRILPECEFDEEGCIEGIACLDNYSREWDESRGTWSSDPRHDQWSHGADSFRQFAQAFQPDEQRVAPREQPLTYSRAGY